MANEPKNQGEGDRESARRYNEAAKASTEKRTQAELTKPQNLTKEQEAELRRAEEAGKARSKGEDPQVSRGTKK